MHLERKQIFSYFVLGLIVSITFWLLMLGKKQPYDKNAINHPDAFMTNIIAAKFNNLGKVKTKLFSPRATHYPKDNTTYLTTPHTIIYSSSPNPWVVDATHGKATYGYEEITLWKKVKLFHPKDSKNPNIILLTEKITLLPIKEIAKTEMPVTVFEPGSKVSAIGMRVDFKTGNIKLLSNTQGTYAPES